MRAGLLNLSIKLKPINKAAIALITLCFSLSIAASNVYALDAVTICERNEPCLFAYAKRGDSLAAYELGHIYKARMEYTEALNWYKKSYELGNKSDGAYAVGVLYDDYLKDYSKAIEWYQIAYNEGSLYASYALGLLYENIYKDYPKAIEWYQIAHKQDEKKAAYALGLLYKNILKDYPNAIKWYEIAHSQKDKDAAYALGLLYDDILKDYLNAIKWYKIAHNDIGDKKAAYALGLLYDDILKDYPKALKWYQVANKEYKNGHFGALCRIGLMYRDGKGVKKDLAKARSLLQQAAKDGSKVAKEALTQLDRLDQNKSK